MKIEMVIIVIAMLFCAYGLGYAIGYRHCFDFLKEELRKYRENKDG